MKIKGFRSIPIVAVVFVIGFGYYTTIFIFMEELWGLKSSNGLLNSLVFTCSIVMCVVSFLYCLFRDPGRPPFDYVPEMSEEDLSEQGLKKNTSLGLYYQASKFCWTENLRYCDKCSAFKPPRAHHCRVCQRCVLKMDHHCMWINNCVGFSNYKPFLILVLYATISCIHSMVVIVTILFQKEWEFQGWSSLKIFYFTFGLGTTGLSLTLGTLLIWHIYLLTHNLTTIEYHDGIRAIWLARKSGKSYEHPFDLGVHRNMTLILGPNMLKWFCPTAMGHLRDGTSFPISRRNS